MSDTEKIKKLIDNKNKDGKYIMPLITLISEGDYSVDEIFDYATWKGSNVATMHLLLKHSSKIKKYIHAKGKSTPFMWAIFNSQSDVIRSMLDKFQEICYLSAVCDVNNRDALMCALDNNNPSIKFLQTILIEKYLDNFDVTRVDNRGKNAPYMALMNSHPLAHKVVEKYYQIVERDFYLSSEGNNIFMTACKCNDKASIMVALKYSVKIDFTLNNNCKRNYLHLLKIYNDEHIIHLVELSAPKIPELECERDFWDNLPSDYPIAKKFC